MNTSVNGKTNLRNNFHLTGLKEDIDDFYRSFKICLWIETVLSLIFLAFTILNMQEFTREGFVLVLISFGMMFFYSLGDLLFLRFKDKISNYSYLSFVEFVSAFSYLGVVSCFLGLAMKENKTLELAYGMWVVGGMIVLLSLLEMSELASKKDSFKKFKKVIFGGFVFCLIACLVFLAIYFIKSIQTQEQIYYFALNCYAAFFLLLVMPCVAFYSFTKIRLEMVKKEKTEIEPEKEKREEKISSPTGRRDENVSDCEEDSSSHYA
ncbi:MAG: hypothetical protein LKJ88_03825 [Bacilli bacterium]|jgi:uncharacterized membrane protein|nr:hypothetical protein [Bacilli bacterium]